MKLIGKLSPALSVVVGALAAAPVAHADAQDTRFLNSLSAEGINVNQPDTLISFAHTMCDVLGTPGAIGPMYGLMASQQLSPMQASNVSLAGVKAYCPDNPNVAPMFAMAQMLLTPPHV
jgi:hypothetical protein